MPPEKLKSALYFEVIKFTKVKTVPSGMTDILLAC